jgi:hypothetical protein
MNENTGESQNKTFGDEEERKLLHDFSNPLAIAAGMIEAILDDCEQGEPLSETQKRRLQKALAATDRLRNMLMARREQLLARRSAKTP